MHTINSLLYIYIYTIEIRLTQCTKLFYSVRYIIYCTYIYIYIFQGTRDIYIYINVYICSYIYIAIQETRCVFVIAYYLWYARQHLCYSRLWNIRMCPVPATAQVRVARVMATSSSGHKGYSALRSVSQLPCIHLVLALQLPCLCLVSAMQITCK